MVLSARATTITSVEIEQSLFRCEMKQAISPWAVLGAAESCQRGREEWLVDEVDEVEAPPVYKANDPQIGQYI